MTSPGLSRTRAEETLPFRAPIYRETEAGNRYDVSVDR